MIASIAFRNFKALRNTQVELKPFNVIIGPNGSGKTSLIEAVMRLRTLSRLPIAESTEQRRGADSPEIEFRFAAPYADIVARLGCVSEAVCDTLAVSPSGAEAWPTLRDELATVRAYSLDHRAIGATSDIGQGGELQSDGRNLAAVLANLRRRAPDAFSALVEEALRLMPEFQTLQLIDDGAGRVELALRLVEDADVPASELSQGTLYLLAVLSLAFDPDPPRVLCIEEVDRGIHPRMLREIRDALYRLSYPRSFDSNRPPVQIITTSHSPYFIDLFRDHPEEIIISHKHGRAAHFSRLTDRADLPDLLREGSLGDMWFSGILGGVPEEKA